MKQGSTNFCIENTEEQKSRKNHGFWMDLEIGNGDNQDAIRKQF